MRRRMVGLKILTQAAPEYGFARAYAQADDRDVIRDSEQWDSRRR
jgi:hypothetical protein